MDNTKDPVRQQVDEAVLDSHDDVIRIVQRKRLEAVLNNDELSSERISLLRDTAKTSIDLKKMVSDDTNAAADREIAKATIEALGKAGRDFAKHLPPAEGRTFDADVLPEVDVVDGQLDIDRQDLEYNPEDFERPDESDD